MKRAIGFIALGAGIFTFFLFIVACMRHNTSLMFPLMVVYFFSMVTAIVCLIGDVIRFIGKCFSQGFSAGNSQECSRICPLCGKAISGSARFCGECGCELTKNS